MKTLICPRFRFCDRISPVEIHRDPTALARRRAAARTRPAGLFAAAFFFVLLMLAPWPVHGAPGPGPAGVILFVGDGMGPEHVRAGGMYLSGSEGTLSFESFPARAMVRTAGASPGPVDSAAAATAIATGRKVYNGVVSLRLPGDGAPLVTMLEGFKSMGWATGLVTTTFVTHATPAAFGAHVADRHDYPSIASGYLTGSRPDVIFGGALHLTRRQAREAGYAVVEDLAGLLALKRDSARPVCGLFARGHMPYELDRGQGVPTLSEMTAAALDILAGDPEGFFLMVEGGRIDHASHAGDISRAVAEVAEFSRAVETAVEWAEKNNGKGKTLIVVTADHETGGLRVIEGRGPGKAPLASWGSKGHTTVNVPLYARGPGAGEFGGVIESRDIHSIIMGLAGAGGGGGGVPPAGP